MKKRLVAIEVDGDVGIHARAEGNYMTLCGLDGGLTSGDQRAVELPDHPLIDCAACAEAVKIARRLRVRDFVPGLAEKLR